MDSARATGHTGLTFLTVRPTPLHIRLEKYDHRKGNHRYCLLRLERTLLGEWCVERTAGPLGAPGGQTRRLYLGTYSEAQQQMDVHRNREIKRGFVPIPVQLGLL